MANTDSDGEPGTAPEPNQWYDITLGSSFKDDQAYSPKFCTLRYEFKPASVDNTQPGSMHKNKDNRVTVELQNNQPGKPKVSFEGVSEDYKDTDAVLFFDGENFRLEKLHRAVKRLRYVRVAGESMAGSALVSANSFGPPTEWHSSPVSKGTEVHPSNRDIVQPVQEEEIDINNPVSLEHGNLEEDHPRQNPNAYESEEDVNIDDDDDDDDSGGGGGSQGTIKSENPSARELRKGGLDIDINLPHQADTEDDEIADVEVNANDDEAEKGLNAAEALRAQVNAELIKERERSSSSTSGSESESESSETASETTSSGSGSGTASEDSH